MSHTKQNNNYLLNERLPFVATERKIDAIKKKII